MTKGLFQELEVNPDFPMIYRWGNNPVRAARKGQRCRILCTGTKRSALVEFEDGFLMVTSVRAVMGIFPSKGDLND